MRGRSRLSLIVSRELAASPRFAGPACSDAPVTWRWCRALLVLLAGFGDRELLLEPPVISSAVEVWMLSCVAGSCRSVLRVLLSQDSSSRGP